MCFVVSFGMLAYYTGLFSAEAIRAEGIDDILGGGLVDTLWWSLKHVLDPGALSENYGAPLGVIVFALFNSIMGLTLTGGLIGLIVNSLQNMLVAAKQGSSSIEEDGHVIILGWNRKGPSLVKQFCSLNTKQRLVILCSSSPEQVLNSLKSEGISRRRSKILALTGSITSAAELDRIGISKAAHVVILAEGTGLQGSFSDVNTIKSLMVIQSKILDSDAPSVIAEVIDSERLDFADIACSSSYPLVCSSLLVSKTLVQCARNPGYAPVYSELFSSDELTFELFSHPDLDGVLFGEACLKITNATVIGVSWEKTLNDGSKKRTTVLNPESDYDLAGDDQLVVINKRNTPVLMNSNIKVNEHASHSDPIDRPGINKVLIFSNSPNLPAIISELSLNASVGVEITLACKNANHIVAGLKEDRNLQPDRQSAVVGSISITAIEFDLNSRWSLNHADLHSYDAIFVLADESETKVDADSSTTLIMLILADALKNSEGALPPIVVELLDSKTLDVLGGSPISDSVISTEFASAILLQVVRNPFLESIYSELINAGGIEMGFRQVGQYMESESSTGYLDAVNRAFEVNELVIGYQIGSGIGAKIHLNPDKYNTPSLNPTDRLIVLAQQLYT